MQNYYLCPFCRSQLKIGEYIIFATRTSDNNRGLLLLHPELGNYTSVKHPSYKFDKGDSLSFCCPLCHGCLDSEIDKNLIQLLMIDKNGKEHEIFFSRIAGEHSSFVINEHGVMSAGEHSSRYTYFKFPEKYKTYIGRKSKTKF